jgi:hypothetical protein
MGTDPRAVLRHLLATLAYRGAKCLRDAPATFTAWDAGSGKTPLAILAHLGDLLDWSLSMARGEGRWNPQPPTTWEQDSARFHRGLEALDRFLASDAPLQAEWSRLLQGPLVDAATHIGQLAMLRRMAGAPIPGESYFVAEMTPGRVGPDQAPPRKPF